MIIGIKCRHNSDKSQSIDDKSGYTWECQCGETEEVEGREPIINTLPHLSWDTNGICQKE
jgi:hypothetical protein